MKRYIYSATDESNIQRFNRIVVKFQYEYGSKFPGVHFELKDLDLGGTIYVVHTYNQNDDLSISRINNVVYSDEEIIDLLAKEAKKVSGSGLSLKSVLQVLKDANLDTTIHRYELYAETYERYESGRLYKKQFTCRGDYLAYFSMLLHKSPTVSALSEYFDDIDDFIDFVRHNPTVADIEEHASSSWYGDGDDFIIYLKNLDTHETLYQCDYDEIEEYDDSDEE